MGNCCFGHPVQTEPVFFPESDDDNEVVIGQSVPLLQRPVFWESEVPMTRGQLQGKRDTFWETSPIYDGRKEIWDALKAAVEAAEDEDYDLAQAILTGASITLPNGKLTDAYDELGNKYNIPVYCLSKPTNLIDDSSYEDETQSIDPLIASSDTLTIKVRLTTLSKDVKLVVSSTDTIYKIKEKLALQYQIPSSKLTMLFSGRILTDSTIIGHLKIPKGFVIQAIVR